MASASGHITTPKRLFPQFKAADGPLPLTPIVFGGAAFSIQYNQADHLDTSVPYETLLYAFRSGINAVDTSPYYTRSQEIIGKILTEPDFLDEFPRSSYHLLTKCGRYGEKGEDFHDYSPDRIEASVKESLKLLGTDYLDGVYLHDAEFVADDVGHASSLGDSSQALKHPELYGLADGDAGKVHGSGDRTFLEALERLHLLKTRGLVRKIGFSGYPLATLLRLARLAQGKGIPVDILQSYSHHTLQNARLTTFMPQFRRAGVGQVINASPLSMGLLRNGPSPPWHPAPRDLIDAVKGVEDVAKISLGFGLTSASPADWFEDTWTSTVVGFSNPEEARQCTEIYDRLFGADLSKRRNRPRGEGEEAQVVEAIEGVGYLDWSWPSSPRQSDRKKRA